MTRQQTAIPDSGPRRGLATALFLSLLLTSLPQPARALDVPADELQAIADDAYIYAYPLLLMEMSRRVQTNVEKPTPGGFAPMNQIAHLATPPAAGNAGTRSAHPYALSSSLWFEVSKEPLVISLPAPGERQVLVNVIDLWGDVVASLGPRTTGRSAVAVAIVGPRWKGRLPAGLIEIRSSTGGGWVTVQLASRAKADTEALAAFQKRITAVPLGRYGRAYVPAPNVVDPLRDMSSPSSQVERLPGATWYSLLAELTALNPPHANDYPILLQLRRLGLDPTQPADPTLMDPAVVAALAAAPKRALTRVRKAVEALGPGANGWTLQRPPFGTYGTDYLRRAAVTLSEPGTGLLQDQLQATVRVDSEGRALDANHRYQLHFTKEQLPVALAVWSLSLYDAQLRLVDNPLDRYALGSRDALKYNPDGTLDLYLQRDEPEADKQSNWLPTPTSGNFSLRLRWYWPLEARAEGAGLATQDGGWVPPSIQKLR